MVKRGFPPLPPGVKEALERLAFALWFAGVCVLLFLSLRAQLARAGDDGHGGGDGFDTSSGYCGSNPARHRDVAAADHYAIEPAIGPALHEREAAL
jgi:hypothetical protein